MSNFRFLICIALLVSYQSVNGQNLPKSPNMVGFSLNHAIWSNNKGPVFNIEIENHKNKAIKIEAGYLMSSPNELLTFNRFPEYLEPKVNKVSGWLFASEYKLYRKMSWNGEFYKSYFSGYYQYRHLNAEGYASTSEYTDQDFSFSQTVYERVACDQTEIINEFGFKYGSLYTLARMNSKILLMDVYLGLSYQFILQINELDSDDDYNYVSYKTLKNGTTYSQYDANSNRFRWNTPIIKFGVTLNLAYPKS